MSLHLPKHHWGTRGMDVYEKLECIGAGTYGQVYMAKDKATGEVVAIKKIRSLNEVQGLPVTTIREIKVLKCLSHPNLVELKEVVVSAENDDDDDFGLARSLRGDQLFTNKVVTLWYRPPELLLGATSYDASIDMWSVGCVFAELYIGHPIFQGKTELEQITKIFDVCGTPTTESWPDYKFLTHSSTFVPDKSKPKRLREFLMREATARKRILPKGALELIEALLVLDPEQRLTASDCLSAQYFNVRPYPPEDPKKLPPITNLPPSHEYQTKKIRREQAKQLNAGGANSQSSNNTGAGGGRNSRPIGKSGASGGGRSRQSTTRDATEVSVKTEVKREEDSVLPTKKRRRMA
uniref:Cyclin-dependent kinase 2 homolog n=1 Tax=Hyaloperonospora arabidopsidis (strain Emoy2) TaxID=559515 RepID=M4B398_HYAAE